MTESQVSHALARYNRQRIPSDHTIIEMTGPEYVEYQREKIGLEKLIRVLHRPDAKSGAEQVRHAQTKAILWRYVEWLAIAVAATVGALTAMSLPALSAELSPRARAAMDVSTYCRFEFVIQNDDGFTSPVIISQAALDACHDEALTAWFEFVNSKAPGQYTRHAAKRYWLTADGGMKTAVRTFVPAVLSLRAKFRGMDAQHKARVLARFKERTAGFRLVWARDFEVRQ